MRMFVAIELEPQVKQYLTQVQQKVTAFSKRGSFTEKENLHLTIKFIGEVSSQDIDALTQGVYEAAMKSKGFSLMLSHLGFFPKGNRTVVWAGLQPSPALVRLFQQVEQSLMKQGFAKSRQALSPHITLGREVDLTTRFDAIKEQIVLEPMEISAKKISLMESKRVGEKLIYRPVFVQNFK